MAPFRIAMPIYITYIQCLQYGFPDVLMVCCAPLSETI